MEKETTINELMEFLVENMVTKKEAENFATKDDIKNMATKDDIKNMATKDDIGQLEARIDGLEIKMDAGFRMVREDLDETNNRLTKLAERTLEDANALAADVLHLDKRMEVLEYKEKIKS